MKKYTIGELCDVIKGKVPIMKAVEGPYPLVTTAENRKTHNDWQFNCKAVCVPLVSSTGHGHASINRIHFQQGEFALGNILAAIIPIDETILDAEYLYIYLSLMKDEILVPLMKGTANVSLTINSLKTAEILVPDLHKQIHIVKNVNKISNYRLSLLNQILNQEISIGNFRHFIVQEAIQGKLISQDSDDEPAKVLLERINKEKEQLIKEKKIKKEKILPPITDEEKPFQLPNGWEWIKLGSLIQSTNNGIYKPEKYYSNDGVMCLRMYNIQNGRIIYENVRRMLLTEEEKKTYSLIHGDILLNRVNSKELVGKAAIIEDFHEHVVYESMNMRLRFMENNVLPQYINKFLLTDMVKQQLMGFSKQAIGQASINQSQVRNILVPLPPLNEQKRIVKKVNELMSLCDELENNNDESKQQVEHLLKAVLQEAFTVKEEVVC